MSPDMSLKEFFEDIPALGLLGTPHVVYPETPYVVDDDVQLVCKYLKAYKIGGTKGIDKLYKEGMYMTMLVYVQDISTQYEVRFGNKA